MADPVILRRLDLTELQPVERALARQRGAIRPARREFPRQHRHHRITAKLIVVGQVLVAERDANDPLHDQRPNAVFDPFRRPPIGEAGGKPLGEPDRSVRRTKQQRTGVGGDRAAVKPSHHLPPLNGCKSEQVHATLCGHRGTPPLRRKALLQKNFRRFGAPMHLTL
jgi:hypothetical protein